MDWFEKAEIALNHLNKARFETFNVSVQQFSVDIHYPIGSTFTKFRSAFFSSDNINDQALFAIYCFECADINLLPSPPWRYRHLNTKNQVDDLPTHQYIEYDFIHEKLIAVDLKRRFGIFYISNSHRLPSYEYHAPLRCFFHLFSLESQMVMLHAASLYCTQQKKGMLLLGKGGQGKSTSTITALEMGLTSCGDDYLIVNPAKNEVFCLYRTIKWAPASFMGRPSFLNDFEAYPPVENDKTIYYIPKESNFLKPSHKINLALILKKGQTEKPKTKLNQGTALLSASISTISQLPIHAEKTLLLIKNLITNLPIDYLPTGTTKNELTMALAQKIVRFEEGQ